MYETPKMEQLGGAEMSETDGGGVAVPAVAVALAVAVATTAVAAAHVVTIENYVG